MIWLIAVLALEITLSLLINMCWKCRSLNTYSRKIGVHWFVKCYSCGHDTWDDFCKAHRIYNGI